MADGKFRVALSGDFRKPDGSPTYPDFDLEPLRSAPGVEMAFLESASPLRAEQLEDFDALILLATASRPRACRRAAASPSSPASASATTPSTSRPAPGRASRSSSPRTASAGRSRSRSSR